MAGAEQSIEINATPEVVYGIITAYEHYPEFLEDVSAVRVLERVDVRRGLLGERLVRFGRRFEGDAAEGLLKRHHSIRQLPRRL